MEKHKLAGLFSSLRRTTPRVPFFRLAAHKVPTLWTLYRGLLRNAPGDAVCTLNLWVEYKQRGSQFNCISSLNGVCEGYSEDIST